MNDGAKSYIELPAPDTTTQRPTLTQLKVTYPLNTDRFGLYSPARNAYIIP